MKLQDLDFRVNDKNYSFYNMESIDFMKNRLKSNSNDKNYSFYNIDFMKNRLKSNSNDKNYPFYNIDFMKNRLKSNSFGEFKDVKEYLAWRCRTQNVDIGVVGDIHENLELLGGGK